MGGDAPQIELDGQQLALYRAIGEYDSELASWYLGALIAFATSANPEHMVQAAHSIRLLMNDLHRIGAAPAKAETGNLRDKFDAMRRKWEKGKRNSDCFSEEKGWDGTIDKAAGRAFAAVDEAIAWEDANRVRWQELHLETIRVLDVSSQPLPSWIEQGHVEQWDRLRNDFVRVAHRASTTREEFVAALDALERFVLDRLKPRTFSEQATLEALIKEAEGRG